MKALYDAKFLTFNESDWRPDAWLAFLLTGLPAAANSLPTMVPRLDPNNIVFTQAKSVRKHARATGRLVQGLQHKTKGDGQVIDLTDVNVKSVKHYHYLKPDCTMDASAHLKRKLDAIDKIISHLDPVEDYLELKQFKKKQADVSKDILMELEKLDATLLINNRVIVTSSNSASNTSLELSDIPHILDDDEDGIAWG